MAQTQAQSTALDRMEDDAVGQQIKARERLFIDALGGVEQARRFMAGAWGVIAQNETLQQCTPDSILGALYFAAQCRLPVGGPMAQFWLTPRWDKRVGSMVVVPIIGYNGLIHLATKTGGYEYIKGIAVREHDDFEMPYTDETGDHFKWRPGTGDRGQIIGALGVAKIKGARGSVVSWLTYEDILKYHRPAKWERTPWKTREEQMVRKTGVRDLWKYLDRDASDSLFAEAVEADGGVVTVDPEGEKRFERIDDSPLEDWEGQLAEVTDQQGLMDLWKRMAGMESELVRGDLDPKFQQRALDLQAAYATALPDLLASAGSQDDLNHLWANLPKSLQTDETRAQFKARAEEMTDADA